MTLTDAEKTRLLAEGCMGWKFITSKDENGGCRFGFRSSVSNEPTWSAVWDPLHSEAHAAEVREAMRAKEWWWSIRTHDTYDSVRLRHSEKTDYHWARVDAGQIPRGICHAALLALGLAKEEELNA